MIIGITGNSGSGKSSILKALELDKPFLVIDADKIGHKILTMTKCKEEVINFFGEDIVVDCEISRRLLGEIVFNDREKLLCLNSITHKYILEEIDKKICENIEKYDIIFIDAALLIESGMYKICDYIIVIYASFEDKISRITSRDKISYDLAKARLNKQSEDSYLKEYCNYAIENKNIEESIFILKNIINKWESNENS